MGKKKVFKRALEGGNANDQVKGKYFQTRTDVIYIYIYTYIICVILLLMVGLVVDDPKGKLGG